MRAFLALTRAAALASALNGAYLAAGCTRQPVMLRRSDLLRAGPALRAEGVAEVPTTASGTYLLPARHRLKVPFASCRLAGLWCTEDTRELSAAELLAHCPGVMPFRGAAPAASRTCLLLQSSADQLQVDTRLRSSVSAADIAVALGGAAVLLVVLAGVGYLADCSQPDDGC